MLLRGEDWYPEYMLPVFDEFAELVSVIIATYNRAPFDPSKSKLNPLEWCIDSLLAQEPLRIGELIFVNDASNDFTLDVLENYKYEFQKKGIRTEILYQPERLDLDEARNQGAKKAKYRLLYFIDDDCILPPFALAGMVATYLMAEITEAKLGVLSGPVYQRASLPESRYGIDQILSFGISNEVLTGNYDGFPQEFISDEEVFEANGLLKTLSVHHMIEGHTLINRMDFKKADGFKAIPPKNHGGGAGLAFAISASGSTLRYSPDPRLHAVHLRYGNEFSRKSLLGPDWNSNGRVTLSKMVEEASRKRRDTGCRVDTEVWHYAKIRNYTLVIIEFRPKFVEKWLIFTYKTFVEDNRAGAMGSIDNRETREKIWRVATQDAFSKHFDANTAQLLERIRSFQIREDFEVIR